MCLSYEFAASLFNLRDGKIYNRSGWSGAAGWEMVPGCESLGIRPVQGTDRAVPAALDTRGFMLMQISLNGIQLLSPGSPRTFGT